MSITIKGLDKLYKKLGKVAATQVLEKPMQRGVLRLQRSMQVYPPARSGSKYIRGYGFKGGPRTSEKLGQRWTTRIIKSGNGLTGKVGNNASYGPLVQSSRFQTARHRSTGWTTDERAVKENEKIILDDFARMIDKALAG